MVKSDIAVSETLRQDLIQKAGVLEDVPERSKDWHPGSDEMVLDLLHPSLFPLVYGRSRALPFGHVPLNDCAKFTGLGEIINEWKDADLQTDTSVLDRRNELTLEPWGTYQWLPAQVDVATEGRSRITSYINNLHPAEHGELYAVLEQMVDRAIPLWNECLAWSWFRERIRIPNPDRVFSTDEDYVVPLWPLRAAHPQNELKGDDSDTATYPNWDWAQNHNLESEWDDWENQHRRLRTIEPKDYYPFHKLLQASDAPARNLDLKADFKSRGLQIIFKLANIHLTPEKPMYDGSRWHVEGALNEHICATALYYYDSDNIDESSLAFRQAMQTEERDDVSSEQEQYRSFCEYFGVANGAPGVQDLGSVRTPQGRLLVFPNVLQHCVKPFRLADPTRPGHRKILAMFLVDPHIPVLSTANVPPQRKDWWAKEVRKVPPFDALPQQVFVMIIKAVEGFPMSWEDACEAREALMEERGRIADDIDEMMDEVIYCPLFAFTRDNSLTVLTQNQFSFCEH